LPIFCEKIGVFLKNFFAEFFGENILKIITSVPGEMVVRVLHLRELQSIASVLHVQIAEDADNPAHL
jgi:hypothetical protein